MAREPDRDTVGTRVVGGGGQAEIAETPLEVDEKFSGFWYRFFGIEGIGEAMLVSRPRHELRHALRACRTDDVGSEAAFPPDQPRQERDRKTPSSSRRLDKAADGRFDRFRLARNRALRVRQRGAAIKQDKEGRGSKDGAVSHRDVSHSQCHRQASRGSSLLIVFPRGA